MNKNWLTKIIGTPVQKLKQIDDIDLINQPNEPDESLLVTSVTVIDHF